ncbi:MAG: hypothetical protein JOZ29_02370 [Deltaproteobacteria bacterium]|nr:hypothetical protein [Deltaproteobacteria bacterium]
MNDKDSRGNLVELRRKRREIIERIREKMPSEAAALEALDLAAKVLEPIPLEPGEYSDIHKALDALVMHLKKTGKPMRAGQLAREVAAGGWALGDPLAYARLMDMIRYQTSRAKQPALIRRKNGTISLAKHT